MQLRTARGLTQARLAGLLGVCRRSVARWEACGVPRGKVERLLHVLGVDEAVLREPVAPGPDAEIARLVRQWGIKAVLAALARAVE